MAVFVNTKASAAFVFDGVTFAVGSWDGDHNWWPITMTLTLGGVAIATAAAVTVYITSASSGNVVDSDSATISDYGTCKNVNTVNSGTDDVLYLLIYAGAAVILGCTHPSVSYYKLNAILPSGGIAQSAQWGFSPE